VSALAVAGGALVGAMLFRLRGSSAFERWTGRGATTARIVWAAGMAGVAHLAGATWQEAAALGAGLFVGCIQPWWQSLSLGDNAADGATVGQYLRHGLRGLWWTLPAALAVAAYASAIGLPEWRPAAILAAAGLACVPAYQIGKWSWPGRATEVGEVLFGGAIGAAVVLAS